jgi:hypothetical protein
MTGLVVMLGLFGAASCEDDSDKGGLPVTDPRVQRGLEISPVRVDLEGRNAALVGLGSYIVNAQGACNDCHTCPPYLPSHDPFKGEEGAVNATNYLAGGRDFGTVIVPSITPGAEGLPAGLTLEEFLHAMRTGRDPDDPEEILQIMPWPVYSQMTDTDLRAIYAYLSAIPEADAGTCD